MIDLLVRIVVFVWSLAALIFFIGFLIGVSGLDIRIKMWVRRLRGTQ